MAKFHNYYVLCPLIDQNSFLGVSLDKNEENVIVSLGRNVVNKYRLSDQKQIGGWTSKNHLTSVVIYDKEQDAYVGVFNKNTIKIWKEDSDNLDKLKKYKFPVNILKLLPRGDKPSVIIFENGNCASLTYAIENRKSYESKLLVKETETIIDSAIYSIQNTDYICYVIKNSKDNYDILNCPIREELGDMEKSRLSKVRASRNEDVSIVGQLISTADNPTVYFLWNDAKITAYDLMNRTWKTIGSVPWISTLSSVSIAWMGKDHLILFGGNTEQDGAIIVAYNIILGVGSCRYPMKMYSEHARLYCYSNRIILEASNHIGMLPYMLETNRNLSSLLGSHDVIEDTSTIIADWDTPTEPIFEITNHTKDLLSTGLTESAMCAQVIPPLIEKNDFQQVYKVVRDFQYIPESVLVSLLNYSVKLVKPIDIDITNHDLFIEYCNSEGKTKKESVVCHVKFELLNYLFQIEFSDAMLIPHLRNGVALDDALFLITYISYLLNDSNINADNESKLIDWCTLLMDAFYQQFLLTKDDKVTEVLNKMQSVVTNLIDQFMEIDNILPTLHKILSGRKLTENEESLSYAIELIEI